MICFRCDNETDFEIKEVDVLQDYCGSTLKVKTPITECKCCSWQSLGKGQVDELIKRTKEVYDSQVDNDHFFKFDKLENGDLHGFENWSNKERIYE